MIKRNSFYIISLGCAKNLVESEKLSNALEKKGFYITDKLKEASLIIINTCGFIQEAKKESIQTILSVFEEKTKSAKVIVFGCMVQRYIKEMQVALPEVHLFLPVMPYEDVAERIAEAFPPVSVAVKRDDVKIQFTPSSYTYVKISDGCQNYCSYCAIPIIRGALKSRTVEEIVSEIRSRLKDGVKEFNLIAQDITAYGTDIYGKPSLERLLKELLKIKGDYWIRLLYLYPTRISDELISMIAGEERIVKYLDIPLQHSEDRVLKLMNRSYVKKDILSLIEKLRSKIPLLFLRTSFIVGFPSETEEEFLQLAEFIKKVGFEHLGVFEYSPEDDTKAKTLTPKIPVKIKSKRRKTLMAIQSQIAFQKNKGLVGKAFKGIVEYPVDEFGALWAGRIYSQAPEVDGVTYIANYSPEKAGFVQLKIKDTKDYDLIAEVV